MHFVLVQAHSPVRLRCLSLEYWQLYRPQHLDAHDHEYLVAVCDEIARIEVEVEVRTVMEAMRTEVQVVRTEVQVVTIDADLSDPRAQRESLCRLDAQEHVREHNVDDQEDYLED